MYLKLVVIDMLNDGGYVIYHIDGRGMNGSERSARTCLSIHAVFVNASLLIILRCQKTFSCTISTMLYKVFSHPS